MKVFLKTFGCKTNQYDTQAMREKFLMAGYEETLNQKEADLVVVNTCTVTREADRKNRSFIRKLHRENPNAKIAVTGCYVLLNRSEISRLPGVTLIVPNEGKDEIVNRVTMDTLGKFCGEGDESRRNRYSDLSISYFADRTRAFVKIQDGCDHACTYCKVVIVRGPSRSRPILEIVDEVKRLAGNGYQEIVLTGIQLGSYGDEWEDHTDIVTVLEKLEEIVGVRRIRLSSIDPSDVTERLIEFMKFHPKICSHLHLPLQSGDDIILKRMKRAYRRSQFLQIVESLRDAMPDFSLTTDVMVGFPGEGDGHFQNTIDILAQTVPLKVHVFPFSPREGTRASDFEDQVDKTVLQNRIKELEAVCGTLAQKCQRAFIGRTVETLAETVVEKDLLGGHSSNYLRVCFPGDVSYTRQMVRVKLLEIRSDYFFGHIVSN